MCSSKTGTFVRNPDLPKPKPLYHSVRQNCEIPTLQQDEHVTNNRDEPSGGWPNGEMG